MYLSLCGINYKSSTIQQREPLQLNRGDLSEAVKALKGMDSVGEALVLTTCNRIEFYLVLDESLSVFDVVREFYRTRRNIDINSLKTAFYTYQGSSTARHLFKVTSGADSMVIGETQIHGQVKEAYRMACAVKGPGKILHKLFHIAFRAGKSIRSSTEIGKGATSVSGAALEMLSGYLNGGVLCIGISPMIEIAIPQLQARGIGNITIANRTAYKAEKLATRFDIDHIPFEKIGEKLKEVSVAISATGSDKYIIDGRMHYDALMARNGAELTFVDLALPRDIDPAVQEFDNIRLFDLEDIKHHVEHNRKNREDALIEAEEIAESFVREFMNWQKNSEVEPLIKELITEMEDIRRRELDHSKRNVPVEQWDELERLSKALLNKVIDLPVRQLKEMNKNRSLPNDPVDLFRELFRLKGLSGRGSDGLFN